MPLEDTIELVTNTACHSSSSSSSSWDLRPRSYDKTGLRPASVSVLVLQLWS